MTASIHPPTEAAAAERASFATGLARRRAASGDPPAGGESAAWPAAVLVVDITGFTPLTARLAREGEAGAEILSRLLNDYFQRLLARVDAHGGEALKFAGDALCAWWPAADAGQGLDDAARRAAACAADLRDTLADFDADEGARLSLRVGVAAGEVVAAHLSAPGRWHVVVGGGPVAEAARAQARAQRGDLALAPEVAQRLGPTPAPLSRLAGPLDAPAGPGLERLLPDPIRARLDAGQGQWLAELRRVTVLFVQALGLSHERAGWPARVQALQARADVIVRRYEGWLKEVVTDDHGVGLVVVFGLPPFSHEDDAARGVRAALELRDAIAALEPGLEAAIGVTTGRCFCGIVGSDVRREYAVVGDAMNVAARLQERAARAPAGEDARLLCDASTRRHAGDALAFDELVPLRLKGKDEPVPVWRPRRPEGIEGVATFAVAAPGAIIGREAERQALRAAVARAASRGTPGAWCLVGEAGIGKSRLVAAFCQDAAASGVDVLSGGGDAIEAATPYFSWRPILAALIGLGPADTPASRRAAVERWLGPGAAPRAPLLGALFALEGGDTPVTAGLTGAARAQAVQDLLASGLARAANERPLAVVLENAHWIDEPSLALAREAARRATRLLLLVTSRPSAAPEWPGLSSLVLGPLPEDQALALAGRRLGAATLSPEVGALVRTRAAGHPFFAEQLASALRESGVVVVDAQGTGRFAAGVDPAALALPDTVQGVVTARIDRLPPREQLTLKVASVIGAAFAVALLRGVHPVEADRTDVDGLLDALCRAALTVPLSASAEPSFAFNHVITHEVAYGLMLFAHRRQLHLAVAQWYEQAFTDQRPELLGQLAHHWARAGETTKAVAWLERSAQRNFDLGFAAMAVDQGREAARLLGVELPREREAIVTMLGEELGEIQRLLAGRTPGDLLALPACTDAGVDAVIGVLLRMAPGAHVSAQGELFALLAARSMSLTLRHGHGQIAPLVHAMYSIVHRAVTGDIAGAFAFSRLSLALDERDGGHLRAPVVFIHHYFNYHWMAPAEDCLAMADSAADAGFAAGDVMYACFNNSTYSMYLLEAGRPLPFVMDEARRCHARNGGRVLNAAYHCVLVLQVAKALAGLTAGPLQLGDAEHDEARDLAAVLDSDMLEEAGWYCAMRARLHYWFDDAPGALAWSARAERALFAVGAQIAGAELVTYRALAWLARAQQAGAPAADLAAWRAQGVAGLDQVKAWEAAGATGCAWRRLMLEGELARVDGRDDEAAHALTEAARLATSIGRIHEAALAHERQARLLAARDDVVAAAQARARAREGYEAWGAKALVAKLG